MTEQKINAGDGFKFEFDAQPGPHGEHKRVRIYHKERLVASMRRSAFDRAVEACAEKRMVSDGKTPPPVRC